MVYATAIPENTMYSANVGLMLGHRLRRCPNINPALAEYIVFPVMHACCAGDIIESHTDSTGI